MTAFDAGKYWEARLAGRYTFQGVGYSSLGRAYNSWMYRVRKYVFRRLIASLDLDLKNTSVLDVGSGTGFYIEQWKRLKVRSVTGVDITHTAVENLKRRFPEDDFYQADIGIGLPWAQTTMRLPLSMCCFILSKTIGLVQPSRIATGLFVPEDCLSSLTTSYIGKKFSWSIR